MTGISRPKPQSEIDRQLSEELGMSAASVRRVLAAWSEMAREEIRAGRPVLLHGIGRIKPARQPARTIRAPATGQAVDIPARLSARLMLSRTAKNALNSA